MANNWKDILTIFKPSTEYAKPITYFLTKRVISVILTGKHHFLGKIEIKQACKINIKLTSGGREKAHWEWMG